MIRVDSSWLTALSWFVFRRQWDALEARAHVAGVARETRVILTLAGYQLVMEREVRIQQRR